MNPHLHPIFRGILAGAASSPRSTMPTPTLKIVPNVDSGKWEVVSRESPDVVLAACESEEEARRFVNPSPTPKEQQ